MILPHKLAVDTPFITLTIATTMLQLQHEPKSPSAAPWSPVNFRVSQEVEHGIKVQCAARVGLTHGKYLMQLYAFGTARQFAAQPKPPGSPVRHDRKTFLIRIPPALSRKMHTAAAEAKLKLNDFTEQLFVFGQKHNFLAWLDSPDS